MDPPARRPPSPPRPCIKPRIARCPPPGRTVAIKEIPKVLDDPMATERKRAEQIPYLKREVGAGPAAGVRWGRRWG